MEGFLNFCPRCGKRNIDTERHGSPGIGLCRDCGTLFSVMSVKQGEKTVPLAAGAASTTKPDDPGAPPAKRRS